MERLCQEPGGDTRRADRAQSGDTGGIERAVIEIPQIVRSKALAAGAGEWLEAIPSLIAGLERDWSIAVGVPYGNCTEALVAAATHAGGTQSVLKLLMSPGSDAARNEMETLRLAGGEGCVRMLRDDETRGAILLEKLGRSLSELGLPMRRRTRSSARRPRRCGARRPGAVCPPAPSRVDGSSSTSPGRGRN